MQTITFYSYKGGVGRTLALANIAKRLSEFGKKVCMLDFDLEAPGLHYKFDREIKSFEFERGIVDYIHSFADKNEVPPSITPYALKVIPGNRNHKPLHLIPAGNTFSNAYWKKLAAINWHELFYKNDSEGVPFFLDLKEKIKKELKPDYLLIDSRTGITEISGITMSLLADKIVILAANNQENIDGVKHIIPSIEKANLSGGNGEKELFLVLSRIPFQNDQKHWEINRISGIKRELIEHLKLSQTQYKVNEILTIHSDPEIEKQESLKIGYTLNDREETIASDYLKLFYELTKSHFSQKDIEELGRKKNVDDNISKAFEADLPKGFELLDEALNISPNNDKVFYALATLNVKAQDYKMAFQNISEAISLSPNNSQYYFYRAFIQSVLQKHDDALLDIQTAEQLGYNHVYTAVLKSMVYSAKGDGANAFMQLGAALFGGLFEITKKIEANSLNHLRQ